MFIDNLEEGFLWYGGLGFVGLFGYLLFTIEEPFEVVVRTNRPIDINNFMIEGTLPILAYLIVVYFIYRITRYCIDNKIFSKVLSR